MPWYARTAATAGRPLVLATALLMCVPAERQIAKTAGWHDPYATGMPLALSAYAGIAAVVAANRPKGTRGRISAVAGAIIAICLALAAQVTSHLISQGHMNPDQAWLIGVVSAVPPAVAAHLLHLAATPANAPATAPGLHTMATEAPASASAPTAPAAPPKPATPPPAGRFYSDPRCTVIRGLYNNGTRPTAKQMQAAILAEGHSRVTESTAKNLRTVVEALERNLAELPRALDATA